LIVDDDPAVRELLATVLERAGYSIFEASSGDEALDAVRSHEPDAVVLDVNLPVRNGYVVCSELRALLGNQLPIIFLSGERTESFDRVAGILIGADDYLTKPFDPDELLARIARMLERLKDRRRPETGGNGFGLTPREEEVLGLLVDGLSQQEIAERLFLSSKTVGTHIQRIITKMGVRNRTQAVALAVRGRTLAEPLT
jgi:DNA-binding NarL/FixJ family response regulator